MHRSSSVVCVLILAVVALCGLASARPLPPAQPEEQLDAAAPGSSEIVTASDGRIQVFVELDQPAAAVAYAAALADTSATRAQAKANAIAAGRMQAEANRTAQERVAGELRALAAREVYRVGRALNGISVMVDRSQIGRILAIPGVKRVIPIYKEYPTNSTSVPFIGAPQVWANTIGLPAGALGTGIRIGIIDTGIDYMHADFGGTGLLADYQTESTNSASFTTAGSFPTAKVVGGTDFAGDAYTGANAPVPDVNPMDCNGHGSHVSGTAAGFGVTAAGATFTGPYDANTSTYTALRIGPGSAPKASLYGLRVFGCAGSTGLTVQAIDWSIDPNGDNDFSDHLDVINMSLGSNFGSAVNASSLASDNAALAGVIVVTSAGNASDTFFILGAPGASTYAIATAASVDDGQSALSVQVNAPASIQGSYLGGAAAYGPTPSGQTADAAVAVDPTTPAGTCGTDANDGCCALTNAAAIAGKICVVNRGTCSFKTKTLNCQNAGAIGTIVVNNAPGSPPPGMADDASIVTPITIPTEMLTLVDGTSVRNTILSSPPVNATLLGQNGADTLASFSSRGPRRILGSPVRLKPDIAAPGFNITSVQTGHTCTVASGCTGVSDPSGFQAGNQTLTISGTSMACPHMTGIMALLREIHPDWNVEELKALAMNYATHDVTLFANATPPRFGPSRVGGGRVDAAKAALGSVIAFNAEDAGLVSVTFNPEVVGTVTQVKRVRIVNKGPASQTYDLAFDNVVDSPGVSFSLPGGSSVTIPAESSVDIDVQMNANSSLMDHTRDASLFPTQGVQPNYGDQPRNFLSEEGAYLTFKQSSALKFRLPVYMAEKPASQMSAANTIVTGGAPTGSTTIPLSGTGLCSGTLAAGPTCVGTFPNDVESLVSPFELQVVSPLDPVSTGGLDYGDIHYAGAAYLQTGGSPNINNDVVLFGVASWGDWSTPTDVAYDICVDNNSDGVYDRAVINTDPSIFITNASHNDNFVRVVQNLSTAGFSILGVGSYANLVAPSVIDSALHMNNVMVLGASPAQLGMASAATTTIRYKVVTCPGANPSCARSTTGDHCTPAAGTFLDVAAGPYVYNWGAQGLNFGGDFLDEDLNGNSLPVTWNTANMTANGSLGALVLHHHNKSGTRAEVALLDTAQRADLAVTKSVDTATPAFSGTVVFTVTVSNAGPNNATGVVVNDFLPAGLSYVSDDGAGAYVPGTGLWTVGALNNGASATLHITATADSTDAQCNVASIGAGSPLDPNPANDQSTVCVNAPRSADVKVTAANTGPATVNPGQTASFLLTLGNLGDDAAYSVVLAASSSPTATLSGTPSVGLFSGGNWLLGSLAKAISNPTLPVTMTAPNCACTVTLTGVGSSITSDPNNANNTAAATVKVLSPANVTATKAVSGSFIEGGTVTYTIVLTNAGAFDQQDNTGHELTDVLPAQLTLVSASAPSGTFSNTGNTVNWDGVVPAGGSVVVTITATINAGTALQTVSNQATVACDSNGDFVDGNESNRLSDDPRLTGVTDPTAFLVASPAAVGTHTKTVSGNFSPGGTVTYTVTISNPGASAQNDNPGDEFTDVLPAGLTLVGATATSGTATADIPGHTVHWNGSIAAGGSVTISITATVTGNGTISNQGTIFFDADGNGTNESSILTDDPGVGGASDPTVFQAASIAQVPTLGAVGFALLIAALFGAALLALRRRAA